MMRVVLLLGSLFISGVRSLTGPRDLSVHHLDSLVVTCSYDGYYDNFKKYWCRGAARESCAIIVSSDGCRTPGCRFSMVDDPTAHRFTVTMVRMRPDDADTYQCGIEKTGLDLMVSVRVSVLPGVCNTSSLWTPLVAFPVSLVQVPEEEEVEVSCREPFENRTFRLKCQEVDVGFRLHSESPTPCKRRCVRMMIRGQNVSVHPEQEYYDPGQQVTVSCPHGHQPNPRTVQCVRSNETNAWNVTDISCEEDPPTTGMTGDTPTPPSIFLRSFVFGLILTMAPKFITVLGVVCVSGVRRRRRRGRTTQEGHDCSHIMKKKNIEVPRSRLGPSSPKRSHQAIYENLDTVILPSIESSC